MIASIAGTLVNKEGDTVVVQTDGGVGYEITVPLGVFERLPANGSPVRLHTELVVREDAWLLFGFDDASERRIFQRLLGASGFGPRLALALLSTLGPDRTVKSIKGKDIAALATVSGIGKKKAERLILELNDKFGDVDVAPSRAVPRPAEEAVKALAALGYAPAVAEDAVRQVLGQGGDDGDTAQLVRRALQWIAKPRGGR
jgi:Holliday junction DNA helicase RuvA